MSGSGGHEYLCGGAGEGGRGTAAVCLYPVSGLVSICCPTETLCPMSAVTDLPLYGCERGGACEAVRLAVTAVGYCVP